MAERLLIERLGAAGDGVARGHSGEPSFVRGALPGETASVERDGRHLRLLAIENPSPSRIDPFCPYYSECGGCVAQHVGPDLYAEWKRGKVVQALAKAGLSCIPDALVDAHGEGRRRVTFHARKVAGEMSVGFMRAGSHDLVPIAHCPVAVPALAGAPEVAAVLARRLAATDKPLDIAVTATASGLDIDLRGSGPPGERRRQDLVRDAMALDLARLSLHGDVLVEQRAPAIAMGQASTVPRPGGFLQATALGEATLAAIVVEACGQARRVADLFAGSGPFALRLAEFAEVHAVENDGAALAALDRAARAVPSLRRVTTETRDLFRRPLLPPELDRFDALVLDPPRAGAEAQARQLILSSLRTVVMVSCDPGTFARDAAILVEGGATLERVAIVDQFKWSAHVEIVGVFRRAKARPRRR